MAKFKKKRSPIKPRSFSRLLKRIAAAAQSLLLVALLEYVHSVFEQIFNR